MIAIESMLNAMPATLFRFDNHLLPAKAIIFERKHFLIYGNLVFAADLITITKTTELSAFAQGLALKC